MPWQESSRPAPWILAAAATVVGGIRPEVANSFTLRRVDMETWALRSGFLAIVFTGTLHVVGACGVDWRIPTNHFDGINQWGKLSYWRQIGQIDLGDNLTIPLIIGFNPTRGYSPYLGRGWLLSILESNIVQVDENRFLLTQPDGISRQFWRKKPTDTVLQGQGGWKGEISDNSITVWAECGWKLTFGKGKITSIVTPKNRLINLIYSNGRVSEIQEQGRTVLKVESDLMSGRVNGLSYGTNHIGIELGDKPKVETIKGLNVVAGNEQSLHKLTLTDKTEAIYDFGVNDKLQPTLIVSGDTSRLFAWNSASGEPVQDGEWTYNIKPTGNQFENVSIGRKNKVNQEELWFLDSVSGQEIEKRSDGSSKKTSKFASGDFSGKLRNIINTDKNGSVTQESFSYNEKGALIRRVEKGGKDLSVVVKESIFDSQERPTEIRSGNKSTKYSYDNDSVIISEFVDGKLKVTEIKKNGLLRSREIQGVRTEVFGYDKAGRLTSVSNSPGSLYEYIRNEQGETIKALANGKPIWEIIDMPESANKAKMMFDKNGKLQSAIDLSTKKILNNEELASVALKYGVALRHPQLLN